MEPIIMTLVSIIQLVGLITFISAIIKIRWPSVEAACIDCTSNKKFSYNHLNPLGKRYYLSGFQSSFSFYWNDQEITGAQRIPFNLTKCIPGCMYTIKVNPRNPSIVATRGEIAGNFLATIILTTLAVAIILAEYNII